jgi:sialic acid synthase
MREFFIGHRRLADDEPVYVCAEVGHNHQGSFEIARQLIQMAAVCGAQGVKFQKRSIDTLFSPAMLAQPYENENSYGKTYGEHRRALEFGLKDYLACRAVALSSRIDFFATAFDEASAEFLMEVEVPAIKIASSGLQDTALLTYVAKLGKPMIVSTGGGTWADVDACVNLLTKHGAPFCLLQATASYPVRNVTEMNLRVIQTMRDRYPETVIGLSSHHPGIALSLVGYAYGARFIEQHITLDRSSKGTDHPFSLEPKGLATLCDDLKKAHLATGDGEKRFYESERGPLSKMRRVETPTGLKITGAQYAEH